MDVIKGAPLKGKKLEQTIAFLNSLGLNWENGIETTVNLIENNALIATGSREKNVLKCIGVLEERQGEGLTAVLLTELIKDYHNLKDGHLFLFTKPCNKPMFTGLGFYEIASTEEALLMENKKNGIEEFVQAMPKGHQKAETGCIVANCNPFTKGHLYLIEKAASLCQYLYVFILQNESADILFNDRLMLVKQGTSHIKNITVYPTGDYMVSAATFPQYFLKDNMSAEKISCQLDLEVFVRHFAPALNIKTRFVGSEPYCKVTSAYNEEMKAYLPSHGIKVTEIKRLEADGTAISATRVRKLLKDKDIEAIKPLVPDVTLKYLKGCIHGFTD